MMQELLTWNITNASVICNIRSFHNISVWLTKMHTHRFLFMMY